MLEAGDLDGCGVWRRVLRAVEELQGVTSAGLDKAMATSTPPPPYGRASLGLIDYSLQ